MAEQEDRRVRMTKQMLKGALIDILKTSGIHQVSIRRLCERADVNRSTFYKYYGSQYELLEEMESDWMGQMEEHLQKSVEKESLPFLEVLNYLEENIEFSRLLANNNVDPEFAQKLFARPSIRKLINASLPQETEYASEYLHALYVNGIYSVIKHWVNKSNREAPEEMARVMAYVLETNNLRMD